MIGDVHSWAYNISGKPTGPDVELTYGRDSEGVSLRIAEDGKASTCYSRMRLVMGSKDGATQFTVIEDGPNYLTAIRDAVPGAHILVLDKETLRAIYSYTGMGAMAMSLGGEFYVIERH